MSRCDSFEPLNYMYTEIIWHVRIKLIKERTTSFS